MRMKITDNIYSILFGDVSYINANGTPDYFEVSWVFWGFCLLFFNKGFLSWVWAEVFEKMESHIGLKFFGRGKILHVKGNL